MNDLVMGLGAWNWLIVGVLLMIAEIFAPGVFLIWFGLAAIIVGVLAQLVALSWQAQVIIFIAVAVAAVPLWRRFSRGKSASGTDDHLNRRWQGLVGREATLDKPIAGGIGTLNLDDTLWRVQGPNLPAGARVRIVSVQGSIITVTLAE